MTRTIRRPRRGAFTLVEVLVVVSILAILAALATAAFYRVRASQSIGATEATISKLKSGLDQKWTAVLDSAKQAGVPDGLVTFAGNDRDRARVLFTYLMLKNEFPTTFAEAGLVGSFAVAPQMTPQPTALIVNNFTLASIPGKAAYTAPVFDYLKRNYANQTVTLTFGNTAEDSAALLYQILTATGTRGQTMSGDGLQGQVGQVTVSLQVNGSAPSTPLTLPAYIDAWGQPISFSRHTFLAELNDPTMGFTKAKQPATQGGPFRDPLDPFGKLVTPTPGINNTPGSGWTVGTGANYSLQQFWAALYPAASPHWSYDGAFPTNYKADAITGAQNGPPATGPWNWQPAILSAGANKKLATAAGANFGGDDDLISVRMAREGNKGN